VEGKATSISNPLALCFSYFEQNAVDFYNALCQITSGRMFPLFMADKLGDFIIGTALETIETEKLVSQFEHVIVDDVYDNDKPVASVVTNLQEYIKSKGIKVNTVVMDDVYTSSKKATGNVHAWTMSPNIALARGKVQMVTTLMAPSARIDILKWKSHIGR
jgi:hypothetical protein